MVRGAALGLTGDCAPAFAIWLTVITGLETRIGYAVEPLSNAVFAADRPCIFEENDGTRSAVEEMMAPALQYQRTAAISLKSKDAYTLREMRMRAEDRRPALTIVRADQNGKNDTLFREIAGAEPTAPLDVRKSIPEPLQASHLWVKGMEAAVDWWGAMFRLAFGIGRASSFPSANSSPESQGSLVALEAPLPEVVAPQSSSSGSGTDSKWVPTVQRKNGRRSKALAERDRSVKGGRRRKAKAKAKSRYSRRRAA